MARAGSVILLRLEGLAVLVGSTALYVQLGGTWVFFAALFLVPDLSMAGYLKDERMGAAVYNAGHTYLGPALLGSWAWWAGGGTIGLATLIWAAHIGADRLLGFGLKRPTGFSDTHLDRPDPGPGPAG